MTKRLILALACALATAPVLAQTQRSASLSANGSVLLDVGGMGTASITVSGTYSGTVNFEVIGAPGRAPVSIDCATPAAPGTAVNSTTSTGTWVCPVAGLRVIQARMSDYVSGTAEIDIVAAPGGGGSASGGGSATASLTLQETDDASIASGQSADAVINLSQVYSGSAWNRLTFGTAGTAAAQVWTVQGIASMTPLLSSQSGTWTVQPGNTANTTPWLFTPYQGGANLFPAAAALSDDTVNPTTTGIATYNMCFDGTTWDRCANSSGGVGASDANTTRTVEASNTMERYISVGTSEDENEIATAAGVLVSIAARNTNASNDAHLKCTNLTAANTTPGTSAIYYEMLIPKGGGFVDSNINAAFDTALTCYIVLGAADNAVDEVAANEVSYMVRYR